jgi:hypothetical protein
MAMANLTISVDDEMLKRARIRALEENTSVNAVLGRYLEEYARTEELMRRREEALNAILELASRCEAARDGKTWTRDELHER